MNHRRPMKPGDYIKKVHPTRDIAGSLLQDTSDQFLQRMRAQRERALSLPDAYGTAYSPDEMDEILDQKGFEHLKAQKEAALGLTSLPEGVNPVGGKPVQSARDVEREIAEGLVGDVRNPMSGISSVKTPNL